MKIKLLSIMMAVVVALAFTSCDNKKNRSHDDSDKNKSEQVDEEDEENEDKVELKDEAIHPTGDIEKDAEALTICTIAYFKKINTSEDIHTVQKDYVNIPKEFQEFYKKKGKIKEFNVAYYKMMNNPKYAKDIKEGQEKIQKLIDEAINANKKK